MYSFNVSLHKVKMLPLLSAPVESVGIAGKMKNREYRPRTHFYPGSKSGQLNSHIRM